MKIRTDFVTNSSSSSFSLILTVQGKNGEKVVFTDFPRGEDGGRAWLSIKLGDLMIRSVVNDFHKNRDEEIELDAGAELAANVEKVNEGAPLKLLKTPGSYQRSDGTTPYYVSVLNGTEKVGTLPYDLNEKVLRFIDRPEIVLKATAGKVLTRAMRGKRMQKALISIKVDAERADGITRPLFTRDVAELAQLLMDAENNSSGKPCKKEKQSFLSQMKKQFSSLDQIEKVTSERQYAAWGEFADLIPENDQKLRALSEQVIMADDRNRQKALKAMREYISTPDADRQMNFGKGYDDFRYGCETDDETLVRIAKRLCLHRHTSSVEGREVDEIDLASGESQAYAVFDLRSYAKGKELDQISVEEVREKLKREEQERKIKEQRERETWMQLYGQFLTQNPSVTIPGQSFVFCFDGRWKGRPYEDIVTQRGGRLRSSVSGKTSYVVVYPFGPYDDWRVRDARKQQEKGKNVQIILPDDLEEALEDG